MSERRVLVLDAGTRGGLAAVRELGRAGWQVGLGGPDVETYASRSRWTGQRHVVDLPGPDTARFVAEVQAATTAGDYQAVIGCGDDWLIALSESAPELDAQVAHPAAAAVAAALDKRELARRCAAVGLAAPLTWGSDERVPPGAVAPFVVKPRRHGPAGRPHARRAAVHVQDRAQLDAVVAGFVQDGVEPVIQTVVPGDLVALSGVLVDGRLRWRVQQRASRTWPVPNGVSCRARTVAVDAGLATHVEALLTGLGWRGMVEVQFLAGPTDAAVIDVNGRPYGSLALAASAGVDLVDASVRSFLGLPSPAPRDARVGVGYQWLEADLRRAILERRGGLVRDLVDTLWVATRSCHSVWDRTDPAPFLHTRLLRPLRRRLTRSGSGRAGSV